MKLHKTRKNKKGGGITGSKPIKSQSNQPVKKKTKKVRFEDNPVSNIRSQSPRDEDDFYYSCNINNNKRKIISPKEKRERVSKNRRSIVNYQNRQSEQDLIDLATGKISSLNGGKKKRRKTHKRKQRR